jgi:hypothetical protein
MTRKRKIMTIIVDSLENAPWTFTGILGENGQRIDAQTIVERLPIGCGDYTIWGHAPIVNPRPWIAIERKSPEDCVSTILAFNDRRPRFETQLDNMQQCDCRAVIVEGSLGTVLETIEARGVHSVDHLRKIVHRSILSWQQQFNVPWIFCDSRRLAEVTCYRLFESFWKRVLKQARKEERECKAMSNDLLSLFDFAEAKQAEATPIEALPAVLAAAAASPAEPTADPVQPQATVSYRSPDDEIVVFDRLASGAVIPPDSLQIPKPISTADLQKITEAARKLIESTQTLCLSLHSIMATEKEIDGMIKLIESLLPPANVPPVQAEKPTFETEPEKTATSVPVVPSTTSSSESVATILPIGERTLLSVLANRSIKGLGAGKMTALCAACPAVADFVALVRRARTEGGKDWKHMPRGIGPDICTGIVEILDEQGLLPLEGQDSQPAEPVSG